MNDNPTLTTVAERQIPQVSIGMPVYNGEKFLREALESVCAQTFTDFELIISDNASTDSTEAICREYAAKDKRIRYVRQPANFGAKANFEYVLDEALGTYFMWLGDDDWLDGNYISSCVNQLNFDPRLTLVSGMPRYYHNRKCAYVGKIHNLHHKHPWLRVISYYASVKDNGIFYGLMKLTCLRKIRMQNILAGDWIMIANIVFMGNAEMLDNTSVHRELGGTSASFAKIVESLGLDRKWKYFPRLCIAIAVGRDIFRNDCYTAMSTFGRALLAVCVFFLMLIRVSIIGGAKQYASKLKRFTLDIFAR